MPGSGAPALDASSASSGAAWFDANGDGVIESWSYAHGGDSFENFTPPPPRSTEPSSHRTNDASVTVTTSRPTDRPEPTKGTAATIHHAHAAYRRDGLSNAPIAHHSGDAPPPGGKPPVTASGAPAGTNH